MVYLLYTVYFDTLNYFSLKLDFDIQNDFFFSFSHPKKYSFWSAVSIPLENLEKS